MQWPRWLQPLGHENLLHLPPLYPARQLHAQLRRLPMTS